MATPTNLRSALLTVVMALIGFSAICCKDRSQPVTSESGGAPSGPGVSASDRPVLVPLPEDLARALECRREYVPRIELEPSLASPGLTADDIRNALVRHQDVVAGAVSSSTGVLTEEATDLLTYLQITRLLRADAIRCWADGQFDAAAERLTAAFRIADRMLADPAPEAKFRGTSALVPLYFELHALQGSGFPSAVSGAARGHLADQIRTVDPTRCLAWDPSSKAAQTRELLLQAVSQ